MSKTILIVDESLPSLTAFNWSKKQPDVEVMTTDEFSLDLSVNKPPVLFKTARYGLVQGVIQGFNKDKYERLLSSDDIR